MAHCAVGMTIYNVAYLLCDQGANMGATGPPAPRAHPPAPILRAGPSKAADDDSLEARLGPEGKVHRVSPELASLPGSLTENPWQAPTVKPKVLASAVHFTC